MIRPGVLLLLATLTLASPAGAQVFYEAPVTPSPETAEPAEAAGDPIADLLDALPPDQSTDSADPEEEVTVRQEQEALLAAPFTPGAQPAAPVLLPQTPQAIAPAPAPAPTVTAAPRRPAPARPTLDRPVMIDEFGRSPDGPPTQIDLGYEARIRGSASSAQGLLGPLDGGWTVRGPDGVALYGLQLVDKGSGGTLEGAWRAMGGSGRVGLIESLERTGSMLIVRINRGYGRPLTVLTLSASGPGGWAGDLSDETGTRPVTMRRN